MRNRWESVMNEKWQRLAAGELDPGETWIAGPKVEILLDGKVSGRVVAKPMRHGYVFVSTDGAHVNDDNPAIDFRGESWLVTLRLIDGNDPQPHITRRQNWSDAPPSYARTIVEAVSAAVAEYMSAHPDIVRAGALADLNNEMYTAQAKVRETRKAHIEARSAYNRLRKAFRETELDR
jgi:hypothetical protein